jgi:hypothetical protein
MNDQLQLPLRATRKVEIRIRGRWTLLSNGLSSIKAGQEFRMYEPDGKMVLSPSGRSTHVAACDSYPDGDGWRVDTKE